MAHVPGFILIILNRTNIHLFRIWWWWLSLLLLLRIAQLTNINIWMTKLEKVIFLPNTCCTASYTMLSIHKINKRFFVRQTNCIPNFGDNIELMGRFESIWWSVVALKSMSIKSKKNAINFVHFSWILHDYSKIIIRQKKTLSFVQFVRNRSTRWYAHQKFRLCITHQIQVFLVHKTESYKTGISSNYTQCMRNLHNKFSFFFSVEGLSAT